MPAQGERLVYDIRWGPFEAGQATLDIRRVTRDDGETNYEVDLRAHTSGLFSVVYPLQVWMRSVLGSDLQRTLSFRKIQNGHETRFNFDWQAGTVQYERDDKKLEPIALPETALDPLGLLVAVRNDSLAPGDGLESWFTDGKNVVAGRASVLREEKVKTPAGKFSTVMVQPALEGVGGVFSRSRNPDLKAWFSRDDRHLPVRVSSKIVLGSLVGELVDVQSLP